MHRREKTTRKNPYVRSGVAGHQTPGGRKRSPAPRIIRTVLIVLLVLAVIVLGAYGISRLSSGSGTPVRINAQPTDNIQAFGEDILYYDGMTLSCVNHKGDVRWRYTLGSGGDFSATASRVVAWSGTQVVAIDKQGTITYTDSMEAAIRFARIGETYIAVCYGEDLTSKVRVLTHTGATLEDMSEKTEGLYLLDIGFFYQKDQLVWVLGLDIGGNAPISNLSTYEPGKMNTGAVELQDDLVYSVYAHNNNLMVADTSKIRTFNYRCVEQTDPAPILVYGWQVQQVRHVGRNTYTLLEQMPSSGDTPLFSELRLVTNYATKSLRLLSPCFASGLSEKGVYGFGDGVIYYAAYGEATFRATHVNYPMTGFVCMLDGGRAVFIAGNDVFVAKLPT